MPALIRELRLLQGCRSGSWCFRLRDSISCQPPRLSKSSALVTVQSKLRGQDGRFPASACNSTHATTTEDNAITRGFAQNGLPGPRQGQKCDHPPARRTCKQNRVTTSKQNRVTTSKQNRVASKQNRHIMQHISLNVNKRFYGRLSLLTLVSTYRRDPRA